LFINASEHYEKGKRQNTLRDSDDIDQPNDIRKIVETYQFRPKYIERYARRVSMDEIEKNGYNLNISRYVSTSLDEIQIDLKDINNKLTSINESIKTNTAKHNDFLTELGLKPI
jgi:type I restriction enzyme M protein